MTQPPLGRRVHCVETKLVEERRTTAAKDESNRATKPVERRMAFR